MLHFYGFNFGWTSLLQSYILLPDRLLEACSVTAALAWPLVGLLLAGSIKGSLDIIVLYSSRDYSAMRRFIRAN